MKRIIFWVVFIVVLALIVWGLIAAMNKPQIGPKVGDPSPVTAADHIFGSTTAAVTLIEYSDFECPACQQYYPLVKRVIASSTVPVRLVYRHFPLPQHKKAGLAAQASEAAALQGKFWPMHDLLFSRSAEWVNQNDPTEVFTGFAQRIGLNIAKFTTDLNSPAVKSVVQSHLTESQSLGLYQTPSFFVNGKLIENPQSYETFITALEAAAR